MADCRLVRNTIIEIIDVHSSVFVCVVVVVEVHGGFISDYYIGSA